MSDEIKRGLQSPLRRKLLMGMAALPAISMLPRPSFADVPATSAINTTGLAVTDTEVTVGILHSVTGTMAISETGSVEAEKLAIDQINAQGGVLGKEAPGQRQVRRRDGLLDLGLAQGGAAGVRAV
jgi:urea transport system substrate-binding protein